MTNYTIIPMRLKVFIVLFLMACQTMSLAQNWTSNINAKNIGPTVFSGRVVDIAVNPDSPQEFYVAYASGGVWHTKNNGISFQPIFDDQAVITVGDIDVDWKTGTIYIGTGEVNSSRSSYAGNGVYKSTDNGKSWTHLGLEETHHIGSVTIDPENSDEIWVAALGHLYTQNKERGLYHSIDGGKNWTQAIYINDSTGIVDFVIDPDNPSIMYAAAWQRDRKAWNFIESGQHSGVFQSTDNGATWNEITTQESGFPKGNGVGRIGLAIAKGEKKNALVVVLDNYNRRPKTEEKKDEKLTKDDFASMSKEDFLALDQEKLKAYLDENGFEEKYDSETVSKMIKEDKIKPIALKEYVEDANRLLFDTPVVGAEVYTYSDGQWEKTTDEYFDGLYNSYGYYFGEIQVNPQDSNQMYIMGVPIIRSDDGGKTWKNINGDNVHADHHALWINPNNPSHLILGNDGGINISYDYGENWNKCNSPAVGQFYTVNVDNASPYNVYGGTQDNGVWVGPNTYSQNTSWHAYGKYPYDVLLGGDGMKVEIDTRDNSTVYTGFQFGNYFRINKKADEFEYITPKHELGDRPYRWNWQSPILLSSHNQDILYMGANKLLRSFDQGENFEVISPDLTKGGKTGDVAFGTLATISESPLKFGLIYTGSDDGNIMKTLDGGVNWIPIHESLPQNKWISRVVASQHSKDRVYVTLNGYRDDDFKTYIYKSDDQGATWQTLCEKLYAGPVNVIIEDPSNADLLYVGTDEGLYFSYDQGSNFLEMAAEMPNVPVHDLVIQKEANDLIVATHGRSFYKINLDKVQDIKNALAKELVIYQPDEIRFSKSWGSRRNIYSDYRLPEANLTYFSNNEQSAKLSVIKDGITLYSNDLDLNYGFNVISYDLHIYEEKVEKLQKCLRKELENKDYSIEKSDNGIYYLPPSEYEVILKTENKETSTTLKIK